MFTDDLKQGLAHINTNYAGKNYIVSNLYILLNQVNSVSIRLTRMGLQMLGEVNNIFVSIPCSVEEIVKQIFFRRVNLNRGI